MFLGISSMIVASMIDTIYIGWIGTRELAAVSFSFPVAGEFSAPNHLELFKMIIKIDT